MEFYSNYVTSDDMQLALFWKRYARRQRILFMASRSKRSCFRSGKTVLLVGIVWWNILCMHCCLVKSTVTPQDIESWFRLIFFIYRQNALFTDQNTWFDEIPFPLTIPHPSVPQLEVLFPITVLFCCHCCSWYIFTRQVKINYLIQQMKLYKLINKK